MSSPEMDSIAPILSEMLDLLRKIEENTRPKAGKKPSEDERTALAVLAVAKGANTFAEVAAELGIHKSTASRSPGIRRALEMAVVDRSRGSEETEDYQWHQ